MSIEALIFRILPFLFSALRRAFGKRSLEEQTAMINGATIAQVLRTECANGHTAILSAIIERLSWLPKDSDRLLQELIRRRGWEIADVKEIGAYIQARLMLMPEQSSTDRFWTGIAGDITLILVDWTADQSGTESQGKKLEWTDLAAGLMEFAFRNYVKGKF
jgi:hypothetical protein